MSSKLYAENPIPHLSLRNTEMATLKSENNWTNLEIVDDDEGYAMAKALYDESLVDGRQRL